MEEFLEEIVEIIPSPLNNDYFTIYPGFYVDRGKWSIFITSTDSRNIISYSDIKYAAGNAMTFHDFIEKKSAIGLRDDGKLSRYYN
ncbi:MAG: hypothetical protein V5A59_07360 [Bacteroidales bacterium]|nr:hypothetical protein [Bacteroidales bacterium]MBS3775994.1 hypothetical protein [Bacteroidales bacterium]